MTTTRRWGAERGAELIEMVVVTPLLLLLVFGIVDFGFMFQQYVVLTNAAAEGARVGILPGYSGADAEARAVTYAVTGGVPAATTAAVATPVSLAGAGGSTWPGLEVTISHVYDFNYIRPITVLFGGTFSSVTLRARATMRRQMGS